MCSARKQKVGIFRFVIMTFMTATMHVFKILVDSPEEILPAKNRSTIHLDA